MSKKKIPHQIETKVVALLARGDRHDDIISTIEKEDGLLISGGSISNIKKRNASALASIQQKLSEHNNNRIERIVSKTHKAIEKRIDKSEQVDEELEGLRKSFQEGLIDEKEFKSKTFQLQEKQLGFGELVMASEKLSKQMHEGGENQAPPADTQQAKLQLIKVLNVINTSDPEAIQKLIFEGALSDVESPTI